MIDTDSDMRMLNSKGDLIRQEESVADFEEGAGLNEIDLEDADESGIYEPRIPKEVMKMHISGTILSMVNVQFEDGSIEGLKQEICRSDEALIDDALDMLVEDIYDKHAISNKDDGLNFEEWCDWFCSLEGIKEMLMAPNQMQ